MCVKLYLIIGSLCEMIVEASIDVLLLHIRHRSLACSPSDSLNRRSQAGHEHELTRNARDKWYSILFTINLSEDTYELASLVLESYFSRCLGMSQLALAALTILLTGSIPLTPSSSADSTDASDPRAPFVVPTLVVTLIYHALAMFNSYAMYSTTYVASYAAGAVGSGIFAFMAVWCLLFGNEKGRISKRTGADKRTSGWPFKNEEASKKKGKKRL